MTKINIFSGFLGAGKTTLIQKLIKEGFNDKICLIENEFGEIAIDGGFMKEAGVEIKEINSGCICCSLVGDFEESLKQVMETYHPDRIIIEPSGVGKLSDVKVAVSKVCNADVVIDGSIAVVHAKQDRLSTWLTPFFASARFPFSIVKISILNEPHIIFFIHERKHKNIICVFLDCDFMQAGPVDHG